MTTQYLNIDNHNNALNEIKKQGELEKKADLEHLLGQKQFRRWAYNLIIEAGILRGSFNGDATTCVFNEGKRDIGLFIMSQILDTKPSAFNLMRKEHDERTKERRAYQNSKSNE